MQLVMQVFTDTDGALRKLGKAKRITVGEPQELHSSSAPYAPRRVRLAILAGARGQITLPRIRYEELESGAAVTGDYGEDYCILTSAR